MSLFSQHLVMCMGLKFVHMKKLFQNLGKYRDSYFGASQ